MKNKEKFAKEILDLAVEGNRIAVGKNNTPRPCAGFDCGICILNTGESSCRDKLKEWAEDEYVDQKVFTEEEKAILRALPKANWVARDMNGFVRIYQIAPYKRKFGWVSDGQNFNVKAFCDCEFSAVKWEDEEPTSREEILK